MTKVLCFELQSLLCYLNDGPCGILQTDIVGSLEILRSSLYISTLTTMLGLRECFTVDYKTETDSLSSERRVMRDIADGCRG